MKAWMLSEKPGTYAVTDDTVTREQWENILSPNRGLTVSMSKLEKCAIEGRPAPKVYLLSSVTPGWWSRYLMRREEEEGGCLY